MIRRRLALAAHLAVAFVLLAAALPAVAQLDGSTVVGILPVDDRTKASIAFGWLGLFYLAGFLKRWVPAHTIVGRALDFVTQDTRPPRPPAL